MQCFQGFRVVKFRGLNTSKVSIGGENIESIIQGVKRRQYKSVQTSMLQANQNATSIAESPSRLPLRKQHHVVLLWLARD